MQPVGNFFVSCFCLTPNLLCQFCQISLYARLITDVLVVLLKCFGLSGFFGFFKRFKFPDFFEFFGFFARPGFFKLFKNFSHFGAFALQRFFPLHNFFFKLLDLFFESLGFFFKLSDFVQLYRLLKFPSQSHTQQLIQPRMSVGYTDIFIINIAYCQILCQPQVIFRIRNQPRFIAGIVLHKFLPEIPALLLLLFLFCPLSVLCPLGWFSYQHFTCPLRAL